jgi:glycine/D-amino acid oxidase-like deaminating enzyme
MAKAVDYLIVGQGLAGSLLAWELLQRGFRVMVVDNGQENASQIAAGLINPVTGMRLVKSADNEILLPAAKQRYAQLSAFFRQDFYVEKPMLRLFRSQAEAQQAAQRQANPEYHAYLGDIYPTAKHLDGLLTPHGYLVQKQTGYLLTKSLLACLKDFFIANNSYQQSDFCYQQLQITPKLSWQNLAPKQVVFCQGYQAMNNPWFAWLPFQAVKGEILNLRHQGVYLPDYLLNYGRWLLPLDDKECRIGATFDHQTLDCQTTAAAAQQLLTAVADISPALAQAHISQHKANIRPCTVDKKPFIGRHPQLPQLAIFNGFGAKGSLQIPWYSQQFADSLSANTPPPANIQRHYATHFFNQPRPAIT